MYSVLRFGLAELSSYKLQILQFKSLQTEVDNLLAEKNSYVQLKKEMTDLMKDLKSVKQHNDQISVEEYFEDDAKQISTEEPISNVDNDYETIDVVPQQEIIVSVPEKKEPVGSTDHRLTVLAVEHSECITSKDVVTSSTTPVGVEEQTSFTSTIDVDLCPVTVASKILSIISSRTTASDVDVKYVHRKKKSMTSIMPLRSLIEDL
jgi:hypothetical protein